MAHRGRYNPNPNAFGPRRDRTYPSQIAQDRPALATRFQCETSYSDADAENTLRGVEHDGGYSMDDDSDAVESRVALFNRQLREGHGGRNSGDE